MIDYGEIITIDFDSSELFQLDEKQQKAAARATLCNLYEQSLVFGDTSFFNHALHAEFMFTVKQIHKNTMTVDLKAKNPFHTEDASKSNIKKDGLTTAPPPGFRDIDDEHNVLAEEYKMTGNALEAVMGYYPKDESRLCKFYDEKTGGCFKGGNCRLEHLPPVDGK